MKKICIVSSCYNEAENIEELYLQLSQQIDALPQYEWEFLFADNCSEDATADILRALAGKDQRVKVILNQANYGPDRSGANALLSARADAVIVMASDLEDPPYMIPNFVEAWEAGYPVVMGRYDTRKENPMMHLCRRIYYGVIAQFSDYQTERNVTGFGLYDMKVIDQIRKLGEYSIVLRFLCTELGYPIRYISFDKPARKAGRSSYSFIKYYKYAVETLVLTSHAPLHMASAAGFVMSVCSLLIALFYLIWKLTHWYTFEFGLAPLMIGIFFLGGVQLFFIGVIGEYLSSAIKRVTKRPYVIERERINFENCGRPESSAEKEVNTESGETGAK